MTREAIIENCRRAAPKVYTIAVAHALRAATRKLGRDPTKDETTLLEAMAEGLSYSLVPLLAATLAELFANDDGVEPPAEVQVQA